MVNPCMNVSLKEHVKIYQSFYHLIIEINSSIRFVHQIQPFIHFVELYGLIAILFHR